MTPHEARVGAATEAFTKRKPIEHIAINGRWKSLNFVPQDILNGQTTLAVTLISGKRPPQDQPILN